MAPQSARGPRHRHERQHSLAGKHRPGRADRSPPPSIGSPSAGPRARGDFLTVVLHHAELWVDARAKPELRLVTHAPPAARARSKLPAGAAAAAADRRSRRHPRGAGRLGAPRHCPSSAAAAPGLATQHSRGACASWWTTADGKLLRISSRARLPRAFPRFSGVLAQALEALSVSAVGSAERLVRLVKRDYAQQLPANARCVDTTFAAETLVPLRPWVRDRFAHVPGAPPRPAVFFVGAYAHGTRSLPVQDAVHIAFSEYPLTATVACAKVTEAFEALWGIL